MAVRGCLGPGISRDIAARSWPIFDHEWLTKPLRQRLADQPCDGIGRASAAYPTNKRTGRAG